MRKLTALLYSASLLGASVLDAQTAATAPAMEEISPGVFRIGTMRLDKNAGTVTVPTLLNMEEGNLEYVLVSKKGSTHESLLVADIDPSQLHFAMLLLGAQGSGLAAPAASEAPPAQINADYLKHAPKLKGDSISLTASWTLEGKKTTSPVEDLVMDINTEKPLTRGPWVYSGSMFFDGKFLAEIEGSFIALVINPSALVNNPRKGNDDDRIWVPRKTKVPPKDTPVELTLKLETASKK